MAIMATSNLTKVILAKYNLTDVNVGHSQQLLQASLVVLLNGAEDGRQHKIVILELRKRVKFLGSPQLSGTGHKHVSVKIQ
jgi:hypothetical protein